MRQSKPETVVVTGASAGLGRAIARAFARQGARQSYQLWLAERKFWGLGLVAAGLAAAALFLGPGKLRGKRW